MRIDNFSDREVINEGLALLFGKRVGDARVHASRQNFDIARDSLARASQVLDVQERLG